MVVVVTANDPSGIDTLRATDPALADTDDDDSVFATVLDLSGYVDGEVTLEFEAVDIHGHTEVTELSILLDRLRPGTINEVTADA